MVRKIIAFAFCVVLFCSIGAVAHAETYTPYEGTISSTYTTYFKDIISGIKFTDNYVAFRPSQYEYMLVVGKFNYDGNNYTLDGVGKSYTFTINGNYNSYTSYSVNEINDFILRPEDKIIYSDLGNYPQLLERGAKYEMLSTVLIAVALLGVVVWRFFALR